MLTGYIETILLGIGILIVIAAVTTELQLRKISRQLNTTINILRITNEHAAEIDMLVGSLKGGQNQGYAQIDKVISLLEATQKQPATDAD